MDLEFLFHLDCSKQEPALDAKTMDLGGGDELHDWDFQPTSMDVGLEEHKLEDNTDERASPVESKEIPSEEPEWWTRQRERYERRLQLPDSGWFNKYDLDWKPQTNTGGKRVRDTVAAVIPWDRLQDFVDGEENMRDFPCTFNRRKWRECLPGSTSQPRKGSARITYRYHCSYGSEDKTAKVATELETLFANILKVRKTYQNKASKTTLKLVKKGADEHSKRGRKMKTNSETTRATPSDSKRGFDHGPNSVVSTTETSSIFNHASEFSEVLEASANVVNDFENTKKVIKKHVGLSQKRGCQCNFVAKQVYIDNSLCEIQYHCFDHVTSDKVACHGSVLGGHRHSLGPRLSTRTKEWIDNCLRLNMTPSQILADHKRHVMDMAMRNEKPTRDMFVMMSDVQNLAKKRVEELWQRDPDDATSVRMWAQENRDSWFIYQEHEDFNMNEMPKEECTFTLGIQTPWQRGVMLLHGNRRPLACDATFGTNELRYPLYTIMCFDEWHNGIPVAYIITSKCSEADLVPWMTKLRDKLLESNPDWYPGSVIVDCVQAELNAFKKVWPDAPIHMCLWHVRKAWAENIVRKIRSQEERAEILKGIAEVMYTTDLSTGDVAISRAYEKFENLKRLHPIAKSFFNYFEKQWMGKMEMWVTGYRNIPHCGQDTNAALENYHHNLKCILLMSCQRLNGWQMDWLIFYLTEDVLTHYWYGVQCKLYGFVMNKKHERIVASAVLRARDIPDNFVSIYPDREDVALVGSVNNFPHVYTIVAPDKEYARCNCPQVDQGNICKHVIKVFIMLHPEVQEGYIIRVAGTLHGTLEAGANCSTIDSFGAGRLVKAETVEACGPDQCSLEIDCKDKIQALRDVSHDIEALVTANESLQDQALYHAKSACGKLRDMEARMGAGTQHPPSQSRLRPNEGDQGIRRHKGPLERSYKQQALKLISEL